MGAFQMRRIVLLASLAFALTSASLYGQTHTLIALSHDTHGVYELDPSTGKILQKFIAPDELHEAAISPDGRTIFVSVPGQRLIEIIDAATFKEKGRVETDLFKRTAPRPGQEGPGRRGISAWPHGLALNTDGSKLYITVEDAENQGVVVYDVKSGKALRKIDTELRGGHYLQVQPGTDKLYFPHSADNRVVVIDTKADKIVKVIPVQGNPVGVDFAPNGEVWIQGDDDGSISVIDSKKDEVMKVIQTAGKKGEGRIAVSPNGRYVASTHVASGDVTLINAQTKQVIATLPLGQGQLTPHFSPDSAKLYVLNADESLCVIDVASSKVVSRLKLQDGPFGLGGGVLVRTN
jgi:YVTN family beta-propeller protein